MSEIKDLKKRISELEDFIANRARYAGEMEYDRDLWKAKAEQLQRRISELEDGACRFNCRKEREAFVAGYERGYHDGLWSDQCDSVPSKAYNAWLKERDEP